LYSDAILSKVSTTFGFSSASIAASDIWFSNSSSSSISPSAAVSPASLDSPARNGVGDGGAAGGAGCSGDHLHGAVGIDHGIGRLTVRPGGAAIIAGFMLFLASGPA
jgi:hypothetical protein